MMEHEFALHHHVGELMKCLGLPDAAGDVGAGFFINKLEASIAQYTPAQGSTERAKKKIIDTVNNPQAFIDKYAKLKANNVKDLDAFVFLISRLLDDTQIKTLVEKPKELKVEHHHQEPASSTKMTVEEAKKIRNELTKATSKSSGVVLSEAMKAVEKEKKKKINRGNSIPSLSAWTHERASLSMDFPVGRESDLGSGDVGSLSLAVQEAQLVEDLLYCCEGIEGRFIKAERLTELHEPRKFSINPEIDGSLRELTSRILTMCSMYSTVVRFIEGSSGFHHGLVTQALVAAINTLMKEYSLLIARLEHQQRLGHLSLQKFWFYIQPTIQTMDILASIATSISKKNCRGGSVLTLLHNKTSSMLGDKKGHELCYYLTQAACVPYFDILEKWIYKGIISDPYLEFMVEEDETFQKEKLGEDFNDAFVVNTYWEQKYTLCAENIPVFLEKIANKILDTGKYLNVIRQCGRDVSYPFAEELEYTSLERQFVDRIESAFQYASSLLLDMLIKEMDLMARLRSIKHYFLLDQGDFVVQFMDMAEHEMRKKMEDILLPRLESLLELALRTSTANVDPYKDDLRIDLLPYDLVSQLKKINSIETKKEKDYREDPMDMCLSGLESIAFDYVVRWPVSLVLNRKALTKYQLLSRHLFYSKYVERQLCNAWVRDKSSKILMSSAALGLRAFALRQRMLNFVQNFEYYVMFEVIEPHWQLFESSMSDVTNVDEVFSIHTEFLSNCLKDSMLTSDELLVTLHKLMMICINFCNTMQKLNPSQKLSSRANSISSGVDSEKKIAMETISEHMEEITHDQSYELTISTIEANFDRNMVELLDYTIKFSLNNCEHRLMNAIHRLDFNGFYKKQLEKLAVLKTTAQSNKSSSELDLASQIVQSAN